MQQQQPCGKAVHTKAAVHELKFKGQRWSDGVGEKGVCLMTGAAGMIIFRQKGCDPSRTAQLLAHIKASFARLAIYAHRASLCTSSIPPACLPLIPLLSMCFPSHAQITYCSSGPRGRPTDATASVRTCWTASWCSAPPFRGMHRTSQSPTPFTLQPTRRVRAGASVAPAPSSHGRTSGQAAFLSCSCPSTLMKRACQLAWLTPVLIV